MSQRNYQGHKETNKDKKDQARPKITWEGYKWIKKQKKATQAINVQIGLNGGK